MTDPKARVRAALQDVYIMIRPHVPECLPGCIHERIMAALRDLDELSGEQFGSPEESKPSAGPPEEAGHSSRSNAASQECPRTAVLRYLAAVWGHVDEDTFYDCDACGSRIPHGGVNLASVLSGLDDALKTPCPLEAEVERLRTELAEPCDCCRQSCADGCGCKYLLSREEFARQFGVDCLPDWDERNADHPEGK